MHPEILAKVERLVTMHRAGALGGEVMPEDVHPPLARNSKELVHYFTLGMCLNYQRNSYSLWQACTKTFDDPKTCWVFVPDKVAGSTITDLREALTKYKVALQPNKHVENWFRVSAGILKHGEGDVRNILSAHSFDIDCVRSFVQNNKHNFPYLAGNKICNYWLYVLTQYTSLPMTNREALSVAPDTHVIQASARLGLISSTELQNSDVAALVASSWQEILAGTKLVPIDIHTPLWLWSRGGFQELKE